MKNAVTGDQRVKRISRKTCSKIEKKSTSLNDESFEQKINIAILRGRTSSEDCTADKGSVQLMNVGI